MNGKIKFCLVLVLILGLCSIVFTFYKTVIKNDYQAIDTSSAE